MNNNNQYDNKFSDSVTGVIGTLIRTAERAIVLFWDGLRNATEHGTPSLLGFVSAFLPILAPLPVATMTALSLETFLDWQPWQSLTMAIALEMAGFVLWVTLVETLMRDGWKGTVMQYFFGGAVIVYQALLITINAVLAAQEGARQSYVLILLLLSFLPALGAIAYAYRNAGNSARLEQEAQEAKDKAEQIRQEKRQDRKELQRLKLGQQYNSDTDRAQLEDKPKGDNFPRKRNR